MERDDLSRELPHSQRCRQNAEAETHGVILELFHLSDGVFFEDFSSSYRTTYLVGKDKKQSIHQNGPDEDVGKDASNQVIRMVHRDCSVPVQGNKRPSQGARDRRQVDEARVRVVAEVQSRKVEEVDDQDDLSPDKVRADKQHDKGEVQQVVQNEVASD